MKITGNQYARSLYDAVNGTDEATAEKVVAKFARLLLDDRADSKTNDILENFSKIWDEENKVLTAEITSARPLVESTKEEVAQYLKKKVNVAKINFTEKVDKEILGGFILRYRDMVVDGSLKNHLHNLKNKISN
jgi:F-type H+-transporting ATPase subunit delta